MVLIIYRRIKTYIDGFLYFYIWCLRQKYGQCTVLPIRKRKKKNYEVILRFHSAYSRTITFSSQTSPSINVLPQHFFYTRGFHFKLSDAFNLCLILKGNEWLSPLCSVRFMLHHWKMFPISWKRITQFVMRTDRIFYVILDLSDCMLFKNMDVVKLVK